MNQKDGIINCGIIKVVAQYRVSLTPYCTANDIKVGDKIRIWIEKVKE